jgi:hypothetical protein
MRTTVNLDGDVEAAVQDLRRERGIGLSEAVNELARAGLTSRKVDYVYESPTRELGMRVDLTNIGDVLDLLDEDPS